MKNPSFFNAFWIGCLIVPFFVNQGCMKPKSPGILKDFTYTLRRADNRITISGPGTVEALKETLLSAPRIRSEMVIEYMPEEGRLVNTDEVIVRFDTKNLEINNSETFLDLKHKKIEYQNKIVEDKQSAFELVQTIEKKSANLEYSTDVYDILKKGKDPDEISKYSINIARDKVDELKYTFRIQSRKDLLEKGFISELEFSKLNFELQKTNVQKNKDVNYYDLLKKGSDDIDLKKFEIEKEKYSIGKKLAVDDQKSSTKVNELTLQKTKFDLDSNEARAMNSKKEIEQCIVTAPTSGIILYQSTWSGKVGIGSTAWPGMPLVKIINLDKLKIKSCIDEKDIDLIKAGASVEITALSSGTRKFTGVVTKIDKIAQLKEQGDIKGAKFFNVSVLLDGDNPGLKPLETASVHIVSEILPDSIRIPRDFVFSEPENRLYVKVKSGSSVSRKFIKPVSSSNDFYYVTDGLEDGMEILCD